VGRSGRGPGEFTEAYDLVVIDRDSLLVLDASGFRAVVFDNDLRPVRTLRLPFDPATLMRIQWPALMIASGSYATPSSAGYPLHRMSLSDALRTRIRSFGPKDGEFAPGTASTLRHHLSEPRGGAFWSVSVFAYDLYHWDSGGRSLSALQRRPSWFREVSADGAGSPTTPPPPFIAGVSEDSEGLVWVSVRVPSVSWRRGWARAQPLGVAGEVSGRSVDLQFLWDAQIEVIDPATRRVVARRRVSQVRPAYLASVLPGQRLALYSPTEGGSEIISIVALELSR
jgi:hypothetical protein